MVRREGGGRLFASTEARWTGLLDTFGM